MASAITHAMVGASIGLASDSSGPGSRSRGWVWLCAGLAVLPDADVLMHHWVRYEDTFGHRGFFHSLLFYVALSAMVTAAVSRGRRMISWKIVFCALFASMLSHSLLDMLTTGGLGVLLAYPITDARLFFPWRPIPVSPLSVTAFFGEWGVRVLKVEMIFAIPVLLLGIATRRLRQAPSSS